MAKLLIGEPGKAAVHVAVSRRPGFHTTYRTVCGLALLANGVSMSVRDTDWARDNYANLMCVACTNEERAEG